MTVPIRIVRRPTPKCRIHGTALRLYKSIDTGFCCCCRETCNSEAEWGCTTCGNLLTLRDDTTLGICRGCLLVAPPTNGGTQ